MCGGFIGKTLGLSGGSAPAPTPAPEAPKTQDVKEAVQQQRAMEGEAKGREGTMLTGAQGVAVGMEKLQKKKLLGAVSKLGG